jgi:peptidoglycan/xylan/chitin deacetylase (PgdA/CDA1 family)
VTTSDSGMPLVLMYHSVDRYKSDPYQITVRPNRFDQQMSWLWRHGLRGVSMRQLLAAHRQGAAAGLVGLTFDDGYADFLEHVMRTLSWYGFTGTVFAVAGRLGGTNEWDADGPRKKLLNAKELRTIVTLGNEVGSHGMLHTRLPAAGDSEVRAEIMHSRTILELIIEAPVTGFCYPYGAVDGETITAVRNAGYDYACAVAHSELDGRFAIPRTYVGDRDKNLRLTAKVLRHELATRRTRLELGAPV